MSETSLSLLVRARSGESDAWARLDAIYRPMVRAWLVRQNIHHKEAEDLTQDILFTMARGIDRFRHSGQRGAFRGWLRTISTNRAREFWRAGRCRVQTCGGDSFLHAIEELEDPSSAMTAAWDAEHDRCVLGRLLELLANEFETRTMQAFRELVFQERKGAEVAAALGMTVPAVYAARSHILHRLRAEAGALLD